MHSGRPQAIGSCFNFENAGQPRTIHEFHSLADSSISAMFRDVAFWHPAQPGLQFQLSQNPPQVADTHQRRLAQMRQISREFSAEMVDPKGSVTVLRLLPTPLITYEPKTEQCTDGAIFSFAADGTDPDVLLVIENRTVNRKPGWYHALARFHYNELNVSKGGQNIWKAESKQEMSRNYRTSNLFRNETYITFRIR